jgi:transposase InsO family protein
MMCEILELPRSSYYKWLNRKETEKEQLDQELCQIILEYHASFKGILGYRRMTKWLNRFNQTHYNKKRIRRLMQLMGISSVIRRKRKGHTKSTAQITAENVLNRNFEAEAPNTKWLTDVTEFKVIGSTKKVYLSAIIDLYDNTIVSYEKGFSNNNELVFKTFDKAIKANPGAKPLVHSDRGFQYTNKVFKTKLDAIGATQSMSRVGRCIDNGPMEGFWGTLKSEMYYLNEFHSIEELEKAIDEYIVFYNNKRIQERLKDLTPIEYRNQALAS